MKIKTLLLIGLLAGISEARATVLIFEIVGLGNGNAIDQAYGDNVTSTTMGNFSYGSAQGFTPNVTLSYADFPTSLWNTGYGDLTNVLYEENDFTGVLKLTFTAEAGFNVQLYSFDLAAFIAGNPQIASVTVYDSNNVALFSQSLVSVSSTTHTSFVFGAPLQDDVLRIEIDATNLGGNNDEIGIDNVIFGQVAIPEPATCALIILSLGGLVALRRTRLTMNVGRPLIWDRH